MKYRADIDGLRAVAVLAVVAYHAFPRWMPGGFVGVDLFFVISGYLISGIILAGLREDRFSFAAFYARRVRRIFPALALVLAALIGAGWFVLFADDFAALGRHILGGAAFVANLVLWRESGYFDSAADTKPLLHLWSLGIEEQFYLLWPALLVLAWRRRIHPLWLSLAVFSASFLFNVWTVRLDRVEAFYSPATRLWELLMGCALVSAGDVRPGRAWRETGGVLGLACIVAALLLIDRNRVFPGLWALLPTGGTLLLIACGPDTRVNRVVLSHPMLVWVGLISYPLYLWHWPLLSFARVVHAETPTAGVRLALVVASVLLSWGTYVWLERPIRQGRTRRLAVPALCVAMTGVAAFGVSVLRMEGFVERPINRSDRAHFLQYYDRLHKHGLAVAYRQECDFMEWDTERARESVSPSCTMPGERRTLFLWGDSYAQALSLGIRSMLPSDSRLAQVATSACRPGFTDLDPQVPNGRCRRSNEYAVSRIRALKPGVVILAQMSQHENTDWEALARQLRSIGVGHVLLVGPTPQWSPTLPEVIAAHYWGQAYDRVSYGLSPRIFEVDREMATRLADSTVISYVSAIDGLCTTEGCLAVVPGTSDHALIAVDAGHLSPQGSVFVAEALLKAHLLP